MDMSMSALVADDALRLNSWMAALERALVRVPCVTLQADATSHDAIMTVEC